MEIESRRFAVSDARVAIFTKLAASSQPRLDIEFEHPELTDEEQELVDAQSAALHEVLSTHPRVVVVGYASNPSALHRIVWGEVKLEDDGRLTFLWREALLSPGSGLVEMSAGDSFSDGDIPRPQLGVNDEQDEQESK